MAKNRPPQAGSGTNPMQSGSAVNPTQPSQSLPGGEEGAGVVDKVFEEDIRKNFTPEMAEALLGEGGQEELVAGSTKVVSVDLKTSERNRLERAYMHWKYLVDEISALANTGTLVGPMRQAAAKVGAVINDSNAALWKPLQTVGAVLEMVRQTSTKGS